MSNPHAQDSPFWDAALEHYHWDRLEAAWSHIAENGIGEAGEYLRWYRLIEAETITRRQSVLRPINDWLTVEVIRSEVFGLEPRLIELSVSACNAVAQRLGWQHTEKTLIAILAQETEADWATSPHGYCIHKEPYVKICLPPYLVDDDDEFEQAVAHEYAHVVSEALADGYAPTWLEEAISVLLENPPNEESRRAFLTGEAEWHDPTNLEVALLGRSDDDGNKIEIWHAYQQAGWIGRYLASLGDERLLGELLREVANEQLGWNMRRVFMARSREDAAIRSVYGFSVGDLFERARRYMEQDRR